MTKRHKHKRTEGDFVRVDLGDGSHVYGRVLPEATFAFYDSHTTDDLPIEEIARREVLFQVAVMDHAVKSGRWPIVGHLPLETKFRKNIPRFMQDALQPEQFSIYDNGEIRPSTRLECVGLERAAVWEPSHVEDRLQDYYAGRPNKWVESLRMK